MVENLQEELIRANAARVSADGDVQGLQAEVQALQVRLGVLLLQVALT